MGVGIQFSHTVIISQYLYDQQALLISPLISEPESCAGGTACRARHCGGRAALPVESRRPTGCSGRGAMARSHRMLAATNSASVVCNKTNKPAAFGNRVVMNASFNRLFVFKGADFFFCQTVGVSKLITKVFGICLDRRR